MRLRRIIMVLSLLTFVSASTGGFLYYSALRRAAFILAERQALANVDLIRNSLDSYLSEHQRTIVTLAGMPSIQSALLRNTPVALVLANVELDHFATTLDADVCYLMNRQGYTIASSNRHAPDSFVGHNFSFRPYYQQAVQGKHGTYLALGTTSGKRGIYHSYPVYNEKKDQVIGIAVIKSAIDKAENQLGLPTDDIVLVVDSQGVIFISNQHQWLFQLAWQLNEDQIRHIAADRQFGRGPWPWVGLQRIDAKHVINQENRRFFMHQVPLDRFQGWHIIHLRDMDRIAQSIAGPLLRIVGPVVLVLSVLVGIVVLLLYGNASREIRRRRMAELALRQSEARYRALYHQTPAMLHSIDPQGRLVSVSDYWVETMGYERDEVIGCHLIDFLESDSQAYAQNVVFPQFFKTGFCKDIPYRYKKKNGESIEVLLSAIADRDDQGNIQRSLAVSIDVTERNQAEAALREAKETLSRYSKDLERQVRKRTAEITSILKYTPAVVYIKDPQGFYLLVNSRFEELFGINMQEARGKTDADLLPPDVADQFRKNDAQVLTSGGSLHVEERIPQSSGVHTYLSVKFPLYAESGTILGVCGIATDITALKRAQDQLRRLSGNIMANQEKERAVIARELHDELGQLLTALRLDAVWLQEHVKADDPKTVSRAEAMCTLIDTTINSVRNMSIRLRPGVLDDLGLVDALEWYTTDFERRAQIACVFTHGDLPVIEDALATAAYRIAQEALTNVTRHAEATRVEVDLQVRKGMFYLIVSDDGCGFDPNTLTETDTFGLAGMRERAALVGGRLHISSKPGQGTWVRFKVPIQ